MTYEEAREKAQSEANKHGRDYSLWNTVFGYRFGALGHPRYRFGSDRQREVVFPSTEDGLAKRASNYQGAPLVQWMDS